MTSTSLALQGVARPDTNKATSRYKETQLSLLWLAVVRG